VSLDLFTAAKQLADSEIELIKVIENSNKCQRTAVNMFMNAKKTKKSGKSKNVNILISMTYIVKNYTLHHKTSKVCKSINLSLNIIDCNND